MLYTAILVACIALEPPTDCRTHEMIVMAGVNPISAYVEAQSRAAQWLAERPGLVQRSLTIRPGRAA
jgi:hypothetical protein